MGEGSGPAPIEHHDNWTADSEWNWNGSDGNSAQAAIKWHNHGSVQWNPISILKERGWIRGGGGGGGGREGVERKSHCYGNSVADHDSITAAIMSLNGNAGRLSRVREIREENMPRKCNRWRWRSDWNFPPWKSCPMRHFSFCFLFSLSSSFASSFFFFS